jgi:hypothetical protein
MKEKGESREKEIDLLFFTLFALSLFCPIFKPPALPENSFFSTLPGARLQARFILRRQSSDGAAAPKYVIFFYV